MSWRNKSYKWINGLNLKQLNLIEEKVRGRFTLIGTGERFALIGPGTDFLYRTIIAQTSISTFSKVKFIKLKFFCTAKAITIQAKQPTEWDKLWIIIHVIED